MSELTKCNYCKLRVIRAGAKKDGKRVVLRGGAGAWLGWTAVFAVAKGEEPRPWDPDTKGQQPQSNQVSWMQDIGTFCEC